MFKKLFYLLFYAFSEIKIKHSIALNGDGYIELSNRIFTNKNEQEFSISFITFKSNAILLSKNEIESHDLFELKLENGYLIYR
jgi:hypothetical protein